MTAKTEQFRLYFLIYCLRRLPDGLYVALNRLYWPVGCTREPGPEAERAGVTFQFKRGLSSEQVSRISFDSDPSTECIYLYGDACIPTMSAAHWAGYMQRLQRIARLRVVV